MVGLGTWPRDWPIGGRKGKREEGLGKVLKKGGLIGQINRRFKEGRLMVRKEHWPKKGYY